MAEIFGKSGDGVPVSGYYECSDCGHRQKLERGAIFPPNHHQDKPWTLYQATEEIPAQQSAKR